MTFLEHTRSKEKPAGIQEDSSYIVFIIKIYLNANYCNNNIQTKYIQYTVPIDTLY